MKTSEQPSFGIAVECAEAALDLALEAVRELVLVMASAPNERWGNVAKNVVGTLAPAVVFVFVCGQWSRSCLNRVAATVGGWCDLGQGLLRAFRLLPSRPDDFEAILDANPHLELKSSGSGFEIISAASRIDEENLKWLGHRAGSGRGFRGERA
jgi:hypothetical protein